MSFPRFFVYKSTMFDAHAHIGEITDEALVCSSSPSEYGSLMPFKYKAAGILPGNEYIREALEKAVSGGFLIGEIGLDKRFDDIPAQLEVFRSALEIARECNTFTVLHIVREYESALREIRRYGIKRFMVHGFSSSAEVAMDIIKLGGIISLPPRAEKLKAFDRIIKLPFVTESDMKTGKEERDALHSWNEKLSTLTGIDIEKRSESMMKEALSE